jgi:hypothetical protein
VVTALVLLGAFGVLLTAGVLWTAAPLQEQARSSDSGQAGHAAEEDVVQSGPLGFQGGGPDNVGIAVRIVVRPGNVSPSDMRPPPETTLR